jgi:pimeloyl-ACP methyl ester carboxylesterase
MKRSLIGVLLLVVAVIALPPLWYVVFPVDPPPDLPAAGKRVVLREGVAVNVLEAGTGPAVVLVHGLPGSAYEWRALLPELASRGFHAIAYDRVGYGRSDARPDGDFTPDANARELLALLEALDLDEATVVGWSYGGVTSMVAAMQHPSRLARLVLVGTGGPDSADAKPPEPSAVMAFANSAPVLAWRAAVPSTGIALITALSGVAFSGGPQPDWWIDGVRANLARPETLLAYQSEMSGIVDPDSGEAPDRFAADTISVPALFLHGGDDRLAPVAIARYLHTQIPSSELFEYEGASHMLPVTHASQLADRIAAFARGGQP